MKQHPLICNRLRFLAWKRKKKTDMIEVCKILSGMQEVKREQLSYRDIISALPPSKSTCEKPVKLSGKKFKLKQKRSTFNNTLMVELTA